MAGVARPTVSPPLFSAFWKMGEDGWGCCCGPRHADLEIAAALPGFLSQGPHRNSRKIRRGQSGSLRSFSIRRAAHGGRCPPYGFSCSPVPRHAETGEWKRRKKQASMAARNHPGNAGGRAPLLPPGFHPARPTGRRNTRCGPHLPPSPPLLPPPADFCQQ